ncbi:MAG: TusE/DsrC/DsvC family sulfur relay protein [Pseudomonadota bacterium]|nr:MAG: TusE/DsrC/DsvC family sulfur relay protein [Pseudomonadota bacterium]
MLKSPDIGRPGLPAFDEDGFLTDPANWDETTAQWIATHDGVGELTESQWAVIRSLRAHYLRFGALPLFRRICHIQHMDPHCVDSLFNHDGKEAWRIAGLPNPGEEGKAYM